MQRYNYMKLADLKLVFDRIKTGQIKLYEGLDGQKILGVFESWGSERANSAEQNSYNKHLESTGHEKHFREKPFTIGNPDAPNNATISEYVEAIKDVQAPKDAA